MEEEELEVTMEEVVREVIMEEDIMMLGLV